MGALSRLDFARVQRSATIAALYSAALITAYFLAYEVRFDFAVPRDFQVHRLHYVWVVLAMKLEALYLAGQFGSMLSYFSISDVKRLTLAMCSCSAVLYFLRTIGLTVFAPSRGILLVDLVFSLGFLCAVRLTARTYRERVLGGRKAGTADRQLIAIMGAGDAGATLANEFINTPGRGFKPVAFFDDDRRKHGKHVHGVPVVGGPEWMKRVKERSGISTVIIAMPSGSVKRVREVVQLANDAGLKVETLPSMQELAAGRAKASRVRPVEVQDLLGRPQVSLDTAGIRRLIEGRCILVTGAGGSIGSELCRQIAAHSPKRLLMVEQAESNLFIIEQELQEGGNAVAAVPLVADILDGERMEYIFGRYKPDAVFHAAAHKHVYMMERQPAEAIANNAFGTRLLARLSAAHGVREFVLISTDKAINPTSVMGATKRLAELQALAVASAESTATKVMAVRFGNVLGSSGSVIPIFKRQIANGGPVTVTHPEVVRYFMTIPEAVGLVLQTAVLGQGGEIFVLDMGQPIKILDLARQMIELSGFIPERDIEIKFTGLKPGEKLFEELQHHSEELLKTAHPRIMRFVGKGKCDPAVLEKLERSLHLREPNELKQMLNELVPEYTPYLD